MSENKNINVNYNVISNIKDGNIKYISTNMSGKSIINNEMFKYPAETGLKRMWSNYFNNKFSTFSKDTMVIKIQQLDFYIEDVSSTSVGYTVLTGNSKSSVEVHSKISVVIEYKNKIYERVFDINADDYQETQSTKYGTYSNTNPNEQKSRLIQECYNRGIIMIDSYINQIIELEK
ncbi:MAG: hypothetical protein ACOC3V_01580 [bacterium]